MPNAAPSSLSRTQQLADAYGEAWNVHDVDALLALQTPEMVFHLHLEGSEPTSGRNAVRNLYELFFAAMPDYHAEIKREFVAEEFFVWEYTISATLAQAFPIGDATGQPTGEAAQLDTVDVIRCDQGKVTAKDTYLDGFAMWRGMSFSEPSAPPRT